MDTAQRTVETVKVIQAAMRAAAQQVPLLGEEQPPLLAVVYDGLPADVVATCEQARGRMRGALSEELRTVHAALAPSGRFKDWCAAVGINYNTAKSKVGRAGKKQPSGAQKHTRSAASKLHKLAFTFTDADDGKRVFASLRRVMDSRQLDTREEALLYVLDVYEGRATPAPSEAPEHAAA